MILNRQRLLPLLAVAVGVLATLVFVFTPRPAQPGLAVVVLASAAGDRLEPTSLHAGLASLTVAGDAPKAPDSRVAARFTLPPGTYHVRVGDVAAPVPLTLRSGATEPLLLAVRNGAVVRAGVYAGAENVNLGLQELSGRVSPLPDFHLVDQDGRPLDRDSLLGRDTVIAAFHTSCRETCPLYTALLYQIHRSAPDVRVIEVTTDPAHDTPAVLSAYRSSIGASWTFATGQAADLTEFWAPFGVSLSAGDSHTSALALVDRYGFVRAMDTGVPDVGGQVPGPLGAQLDAAGRRLLAGHGEGWGAPQVLDSLRTLAAAGRSTAGGDAPAFSLPALDGSRLSLEELHGRPAVLNFWWAGCPACQEEMPVLQRFADAHPDVAVVLIDPVDGAGPARAFVESQHVRAPVLLDPDGHVAAAYEVAGYPTTVFLHADGTIGSTYPGALTPGVLAAHASNLGAGPG